MTKKNSARSTNSGAADLESLVHELTTIRSEMIAEPGQLQASLDAVHPDYQDSARNLLHYLSLRRHDLRPLQLQLAALGLSSLGRAESHVLATVDSVLGVLHRLLSRSWERSADEAAVVDFSRGQELLAQHTSALLGPEPNGRRVRIMVTMPSEVAAEYALVHGLLAQGMNCMRINCAHDDAAAWLRMIKHLRQAERELGQRCKVVMDLAGPKLRTGPLGPGPAVLRIRPARDVYGKVTTPARVWLTADTANTIPPESEAVCLPVSAEWLTRLGRGDRIKFKDARDSKRTWKIVEVTKNGCWAEATQTAYLVAGTALCYRSKSGKKVVHKVVASALPSNELTILLQQEDRLILTRDNTPGRAATYDQNGKLVRPATIGCTIPEIFADVRAGESVWFDDGKIGGVIEKVEPTHIECRITHVGLGGAKLRGDKGINFPDSELHLAALSPKDLADLDFVAAHADVIELSFANTPDDVEQLQKHIAHLGRKQPAIVLKIETRGGFENLPEMLLTAMRVPCCGVMIARGDLAVEIGFERLAEVQEEILWLCEAAHVPVIWATQVLETLAKQGMPSRAEITDAAMSDRAECVMLNKGPHVVRAVEVLNGILQRMQNHQDKKSPMLRALRLAHARPAES